jgi:hypothetical protein
MKAARDNAVLGRVKHKAVTVLKATDPVVKIIGEMAGNLSYQPHPKRTKFFRIAKAAVPVLIAGMYFGRKRRESTNQD